VTDTPPQAAGRPIRCVVAGGSLVGLSTAMALSRRGVEVTVAERSPAQAVGGGGLGVDVALLREATGIDADPPVLHGIDRDGTAWHLLQGWLEEHAARQPGVSVLRGREVVTVTPGDEDRNATVRTAQGDSFAADLVVGADGARSTVRATVDPAHEARYAGVLLWRTLVDERAMPRNVTSSSPPASPWPAWQHRPACRGAHCRQPDQAGTASRGCTLTLATMTQASRGT